MKSRSLVLAVLLWLSNSPTPLAGVIQEATEQRATAMSERERQGLRGLVKTCVEERTYSASTDSHGNNISETKTVNTTEYDLAGRIVRTLWRNPDGSEWGTRYTYDAAGHLRKTESGKEGEPKSETRYDYDGQGRLSQITSGNSLNPTTFRYDEQSRKTKVQTTKASDYRPSVASGGSPFEAADMPPNLPDGGVATTIYDEKDRPTEVQVRDSHGALLSHAVRIYDKQGRVTEEKQIVDNPEMMIPAEVRQKFEAAGALDELRAELARFLGGQEGMHSIAYTYDAQGRITHTRRTVFAEPDEIETSYNEHGDQAGEITRSSRGGREPGEPRRPEYSEVHYSYRYDTHGNWTEQTASYRNSLDEGFHSSTTTRRTLTYH